MSKSGSDSNSKNTNCTKTSNSTNNNNNNRRYNTKTVLYCFVFVMSILQVSSGIIFIISMEYYKGVLMNYVGNTERGQIFVIFTMMDLFGFQMIVISLCGLPITKRSMKDSYTRHLEELIKLWMCISILIILSGLVLFWAVYQSSPSLQRSTELSLLHGIDMYYSEPEWRLIWDDMQYKQQCCGVHDYKDWQTNALVEETKTDNNTEFKTNEIDHSEPLSLTPYSCCKKNVGCFQSFVPSKSSDSWLELPTLNISAINTGGCLKFFSDTLDEVINIYLISFVESSIMQIIILTLLRLLFLKSRKFNVCPSEDKKVRKDIVILKCKCERKCKKHSKDNKGKYTSPCQMKETASDQYKNDEFENEDDDYDSEEGGEGEEEEEEEEEGDNTELTGLIIH